MFFSNQYGSKQHGDISEVERWLLFVQEHWASTGQTQQLTDYRHWALSVPDRYWQHGQLDTVNQGLWVVWCSLNVKCLFLLHRTHYLEKHAHTQSHTSHTHTHTTHTHIWWHIYIVSNDALLIQQGLEITDICCLLLHVVGDRVVVISYYTHRSTSV